jgi:transposase
VATSRASDGWASCSSALRVVPTQRQAAADQPGQAFAGGEIYLSFPGLGRRLRARIAGEIGEHVEQFTTPNSLQCYAGTAPVIAAPANATSWSPTGWPVTDTGHR